MRFVLKNKPVNHSSWLSYPSITNCTVFIQFLMFAHAIIWNKIYAFASVIMISREERQTQIRSQYLDWKPNACCSIIVDIRVWLFSFSPPAHFIFSLKHLIRIKMTRADCFRIHLRITSILFFQPDQKSSHHLELSIWFLVQSRSRNDWLQR